jgi:long-chain acyl-CoA synthetase
LSTVFGTDGSSGEVLIRGPSITTGYFKRPDLDAEMFLPGGWLRTGDVGTWIGHDVKTLVIVDRIKNLVKLRSGEYVALEKMESVFKSCAVVANICIVSTIVSHFFEP